MEIKEEANTSSGGSQSLEGGKKKKGGFWGVRIKVIYKGDR